MGGKKKEHSSKNKQNECVEMGEDQVETQIKKRIKEKKTNVEGVINPAFNPMHFNVKVDKHILETINEDDSLHNKDVGRQKRGKKSKRRDETINFDDPMYGIDNPTFEDNIKLKKKKNKSKQAVEEQNIDKIDTGKVKKEKSKFQSVKHLMHDAFETIKGKKRKKIEPEISFESKKIKFDPEVTAQTIEAVDQVGIDNPAFQEAAPSRSQPDDTNCKKSWKTYENHLPKMFNTGNRTMYNNYNYPRHSRFNGNQSFPPGFPPRPFPPPPRPYHPYQHNYFNGPPQMAPPDPMAPPFPPPPNMMNHVALFQNFIRFMNMLNLNNTMTNNMVANMHPTHTFQMNQTYNFPQQNCAPPPPHTHWNAHAHHGERRPHAPHASRVRKEVGERLPTVGEEEESGDENRQVEGGVKLRFKHAQFRERPQWAVRNDLEEVNVSKKSYKHLIRGDIVVNFNNCNLHRIRGYGEQKYLVNKTEGEVQVDKKEM